MTRLPIQRLAALAIATYLGGYGLVCVAVTLVGCSDSHARGTPWASVPYRARVARHSPAGVQVGLLAELVEHDPQGTAEVLALVDTTPAQLDSRVPQLTAAHVGPPPGWTVQVYQSGWFPTQASPTGFAAGQVEVRQRTIHLALSQGSGQVSPVWIPAYAHELAHAWAAALGLDPAAVACVGHACAVAR